MAFAKLDSGITKSSLWSEPLHVRIVFISMLAEKDENGFVSASRSGMIRLCNVTPVQFDEAEKTLSSPDPESKNKDFEGRRIEKIYGGWVILNHELYKLPEQEKKEIRNEYMRVFMANKRANNANTVLTPANTDLTSVSVSKSVSVSSVSLDTDSFFSSFWSLYPKKTGKGAAEKSWAKIPSPAETLTKITTALAWQVKTEQWTKDNGQFIPMPATYLNQRRWEDEQGGPIKGKFDHITDPVRRAILEKNDAREF
jgi:hypothetical protein